VDKKTQNFTLLKNIERNQRSKFEYYSRTKRLEGLLVAKMIDEGELERAKRLLEVSVLVDDFLLNEGDIKVMTYSLLGIIKKTQGQNQDEQLEGLRLLEKARQFSDETMPVFERLNYMQTDLAAI